MSHLAPHQELFKQLVTLGESVTDALDYTQLISTNGEGELEKTLTALGERELSPAAHRGLDALRAAGERVVTANDPHRAIDWIATYPRLLTTLLVAALNPKGLPSDHSANSASGSSSATRLPGGIAFTDAPPDGRAVVYAGIQIGRAHV